MCVSCKWPGRMYKYVLVCVLNFPSLCFQRWFSSARCSRRFGTYPSFYKGPPLHSNTFLLSNTVENYISVQQLFKGERSPLCGSFSFCILIKGVLLNSPTRLNTLVFYHLLPTNMQIYSAGQDLVEKQLTSVFPRQTECRCLLLSSLTREHESGSKEHMFSVRLMPGL